MRQTTVMGLLSLFFTLLLLVDQSEQQYAWRPQGRFGKRLSNADNSLPEEGISDILRNMGPMIGNVQYLSTPIFKSDGVVCIATGGKGNYKCFTFAETGDDSEDEKH